MIRVLREMRLVSVLLAGLTARHVPAADPPTNPLTSAAFSPDGRTLAALNKDGTIRLWDVATGKERSKTAFALGPEEVAHQIHYTPDGDLAVLLRRHTGFKFEAGGVTQGTISACLGNLKSGRRSPLIKI